MSGKLLEFKNVSYRLNDIDCLKNISFTLARGENLIIFGMEKSGLNQLVQLILFLDMNYEGDIFFNGRNVQKLDYEERLELCSRIGFIHGDYGLLSNMTVKQNILLPLDYHHDIHIEELEDRIKPIVEDLNISHCLDLRPIDLAMSEIIKTAYARAIATDPDLVISDHAYINLAAMDTIRTINHMKKWSELNEKSLIFATYDPQKFINFEGQYIMLHEGEIVFSGTKDDFNSSGNSYLMQFNNPSIEGPMKII